MLTRQGLKNYRYTLAYMAAIRAQQNMLKGVNWPAGPSYLQTLGEEARRTAERIRQTEAELQMLEDTEAATMCREHYVEGLTWAEVGARHYYSGKTAERKASAILAADPEEDAAEDVGEDPAE